MVIQHANDGFLVFKIASGEFIVPTNCRRQLLSRPRAGSARLAIEERDGNSASEWSIRHMGWHRRLAEPKNSVHQIHDQSKSFHRPRHKFQWNRFGQLGSGKSGSQQPVTPVTKSEMI
jgi:hypothetical protein